MMIDVFNKTQHVNGLIWRGTNSREKVCIGGVLKIFKSIIQCHEQKLDSFIIPP